MAFLKSTAGKIIGGLVALGVIAAGISWWRLDPNTRQAIWSGVGNILAWLGLVILVPWATFLLIRWVAKLQSNMAGGLLVLGYTLGEMLALLWLFNWSISGPLAWAFMLVGGLGAGVYNLLTCDWIAEKLE